MDLLFANGYEPLVVNGDIIHVRDMHRDLSPPPHAEPDDDEDATDDPSDVDEISETESDGKEGIDLLQNIHPGKRSASPPLSARLPSKTSTNEGKKLSSEKRSKGKGKELERTSTPEPQGPSDIFRLLMSGRLGAAERKYRSLPYPPSGVKNLRGPATDHEDVDDADFIPHMWHLRRDMFYKPPFRLPSRRPLPEFIAGPSRITLDDLY